MSKNDVDSVETQDFASENNTGSVETQDFASENDVDLVKRRKILRLYKKYV